MTGPLLDNAGLYPGPDTSAETLAANGEVLSPVIEVQVSLSANRGPSTNAASLIENVNAQTSVGQQAGGGEAADARPDDAD
jgi:hypothetical protein